jgi:hypothetical protein
MVGIPNIYIVYIAKLEEIVVVLNQIIINKPYRELTTRLLYTIIFTNN